MDSERVRESMKTCNCFTVSSTWIYLQWKNLDVLLPFITFRLFLSLVRSFFRLVDSVCVFFSFVYSFIHFDFAIYDSIFLMAGLFDSDFVSNHVYFRIMLILISFNHLLLDAKHYLYLHLLKAFSFLYIISSDKT